MIAYIATETTITVVLEGKYRTIQVKSKAHRNDVIKALEKFKKSRQSAADRAALETFLAPIKRIALESDNRFELDESQNRLFLVGTTKPIPTTLADKILDFLENGLPVNPLVKFWESCLANPHYVAVEELFDFLERNNLPITDDGGFLGYKKLNFVNRIDVPDDFEELFVTAEGEVKNIHGRPVGTTLKSRYLSFINDVNNPTMKDVWSGTISQKLGEVVRIDRVLLDEADRRQACGYGLHVGAFGYSFGGNVRVLVKVFPEDVIACNPNEQKLRTCKYQIVSFVDEQKEVKQLLVDLSKEARDVADGNSPVYDDDTDNEFTEGQVIKAWVTAPGIVKDSFYYVVDSDGEDVLIINEDAEEEWYHHTFFVKR